MILLEMQSKLIELCELSPIEKACEFHMFVYEKLAYLKSRFPFNSTPTIYVYKDKKKDHHVGKMNVSETVDFLERNGMLSTDKK